MLNELFHESVPVILKEDEVQDIDNPSDWKIAEYKFKNLREIGEL